MLTLEESVRLLIDGLAETNRKFAAENEKLAKSLAESRAEAEARRAEAEAKRAEAEAKRAEYEARRDEAEARLTKELLEYKEENRIGFQELRKSHKKTAATFETQWGKLVEALVNNQVIPLLLQQGIVVEQTVQRTKGTVAGRRFEFDIIAENGDVVVVIEVKTTLRVDDVRYFLDKLDHVKEWLPKYANMTVYGAVAFIHEASEASLYAERAGLFSILATGSSAKITNQPAFKPHKF